MGSRPSAPALQARSRAAASLPGSQNCLFVISISQMGVLRLREDASLLGSAPSCPASGAPFCPTSHSPVRWWCRQRGPGGEAGAQ